MLGANGVVAANIVIAAGAGHAIKMAGDDRVSVCFLGDGATNRGPFLEGVNWAAVYRLPVLFVCEDNEYSAMTRTGPYTAGGGPGERARSLGVHTVEVDGNDLPAVMQASADAVDRLRAGEGPVFLHARTYRLSGHTGVDPAAYRNADEVAAGWTRDPIARTRALLIDAGVAPADLDHDVAAITDEIEAAYQHAAAASFPDPDRAYADVQDVGDPRMAAF
jgi:pyruvate dehydrogenase E1 component alpha subunit